MRRLSPRLVRAGLWVGALALLGGAAIATGAIPAGDGAVSGCVAKTARTSSTGLLGPTVTLDRKGTLRAIDAEGGQACAGDEEPLTFNVQGQQGPPGDPGATNVVVRTGAPVIVKKSGTFTSVATTCEPGERAVSGGHRFVTGLYGALQVIDSRPEPLSGTPTGWVERFRLNTPSSGAEATVEGYVICAAP